MRFPLHWVTDRARGLFELGANTIQQTIGARTAFTITLNSLASATYVASSSVDFGTPSPLDVVVEVAITPGTVAGNKQAIVFMQLSMDNSNFSTGPTSGTTTTDQPDLYQIGVLPLNSNATLQRKFFSIAAATGFAPRAGTLVVLNDTGVAFAAAGCSANYTTIVGTFT